MKKCIIAVMAFVCVNVNAQSFNVAAASDKLQSLRAEQTSLEQQMLEGDVIEMASLLPQITVVDKEIDAIENALAMERFQMENEALASNPVEAMVLIKRVIEIDNIIGLPEADDEEVEE